MKVFFITLFLLKKISSEVFFYRVIDVSEISPEINNLLQMFMKCSTPNPIFQLLLVQRKCLTENLIAFFRAGKDFRPYKPESQC